MIFTAVQLFSQYIACYIVLQQFSSLIALARVQGIQDFPNVSSFGSDELSQPAPFIIKSHASQLGHCSLNGIHLCPSL